MAIYTEYGRYLKAKSFKEYLESTSHGGVYMLLGLGCPVWDLDNDKAMPIAPYNKTITSTQDTDLPNNLYNQFFDKNITLKFDNQSISVSNHYYEICKDLVPMFPGVWSYETPHTILTVNGTTVTTEDFNEYYIQDDSGVYKLHHFDGDSGVYIGDVELPSDNAENYVERQYFAEMVLRGKNRDLPDQPVGLLGAIKCDVSFVRDIGADESVYSGKENQFWYGDRYWETCSIEEYAEMNKDPLNSNNLKYPHHLFFSAVINPRSLCDNLSIDQCIVPMQIALFLKKTPNGERYYRVGENLFNFGQFPKDTLSLISSEINMNDSNILNFTIKCRSEDPALTQLGVNEWPDGDFEFILNDYIKGSPRQPHTVDRIGYIVGF